MLSELPYELLIQIVAHLPTAQSLLHLSLTCRRLHEYVGREGYRVFVQSRFPSLNAPPYWESAAHALTTLSRAWDRKAFIARYITPSKTLVRLPRGRQAPPPYARSWTHQTMGYQPVIDSYEDWIADDWSSRHEVLAWGAGAELMVRLKTMGHTAEQMWQDARDDADRSDRFDQHHHRVEWLSYKEEGHAEGRDDITSVNILRPWQSTEQQPSRTKAEVVVGRASGGLALVILSASQERDFIRHNYVTDGRPVRSASVSVSEDTFVAACLSDTALALYPLKSSDTNVSPVSEITVIPSGKPGRTWSTRFLTHDRLAVGLGPSIEPIHVYSISPAGVSPEPLRKFGTAGADVKIFGDDRIDTAGCTTSGTSTVYPIAPIAASSQAGGREGEIFLSGWYDGVVRLHDMRSPSCCIATYQDPIDNFSAIYSLLPLGRERFIAGGARHAMMKVFDLRMAGGKAYYSVDLDPCSTTTSRKPPTPRPLDSGVCCDFHYEHKYHRRDWNLFLNPRGPSYHNHGSRRSSESPVYSLSSPSACSPSVFAGIENNIVQFDMVAIMDKHPDPVYQFSSGVELTESLARDARRKWGPRTEVLRLAMYEQVPIGSMKVRVQAGVDPVALGRGYGEPIPGWDQRWASGTGS